MRNLNTDDGWYYADPVSLDTLKETIYSDGVFEWDDPDDIALDNIDAEFLGEDDE